MKRIVVTSHDLHDADFPQGRPIKEQMEFLINYAIVAPSIYNSQPWQFDISDKGIDLYADRTRPMPVRDPKGRQIIISCGAALFYLKLAARHFGYSVRVQKFPDLDEPDLLARVQLLEPKRATACEEHLFHAIYSRHTNREKYDKRALPTFFAYELAGAALDEGCSLAVAEKENDMLDIGVLVAEADRAQWSDRRFRNEMAEWLRSNSSLSFDGIQADVLGLRNVAPDAVPHMVRSQDLGGNRAAHDAELIRNSSAIAVVATQEDEPRDWLMAGMALAHILLHTAGAGLSASFMNQPVEVARLRPELRSLLSERCDCSGYPQLVLRLGYGPKMPPTLRRSAGSVMI